MFNLLHFDKRETSPHPGEGCGHRLGLAGSLRLPPPTSSRPLSSAALPLVPGPYPPAFRSQFSGPSPVPLPLTPSGTSAQGSVLLRKPGSQGRGAAAFTRDPSLKEESLFMLTIGLFLKAQKQVGSRRKLELK